MKRAQAIVVAGLLVMALGVAGLGATQQIKLFNQAVPLEIDGSQPCFVAHGWTELDSDLPEGQTPREYLIENFLFELEVDDSFVAPTNFVVRRLPEARNPYGEGAWTILWYFRFKANYFSEGEHEFHGIWHHIPGPWERQRTIVVVYPDK